jgi:hypothetical protein
MGDAPRDLSGPRGTTGLGDPGRYSFGEDAGQQGTGPGVGFALPEYGSNLDAAPPLAHRVQWHLVALVSGHSQQRVRESSAHRAHRHLLARVNGQARQRARESVA